MVKFNILVWKLCYDDSNDVYCLYYILWALCSSYVVNRYFYHALFVFYLHFSLKTNHFVDLEHLPYASLDMYHVPLHNGMVDDWLWWLYDLLLFYWILDGWVYFHYIQQKYQQVKQHKQGINSPRHLQSHWIYHISQWQRCSVLDLKLVSSTLILFGLEMIHFTVDCKR